MEKNILIDPNSLPRIKSKHRKYLKIVFVLSLILLIILPSSIGIYITGIYPFMTFFFYAYLGISFGEELADYLILNHKNELKEQKISTSRIGIYTIRHEMYYKKKELSEISPVVKAGIELALFYGKLVSISFISIIILFIFLIIKNELTK